MPKVCLGTAATASHGRAGSTLCHDSGFDQVQHPISRAGSTLPGTCCLLRLVAFHFLVEYLAWWSLQQTCPSFQVVVHQPCGCGGCRHAVHAAHVVANSSISVTHIVHFTPRVCCWCLGSAAGAAPPDATNAATSCGILIQRCCVSRAACL